MAHAIGLITDVLNEYYEYGCRNRWTGRTQVTQKSFLKRFTEEFTRLHPEARYTADLNADKILEVLKKALPRDVGKSTHAQITGKTKAMVKWVMARYQVGDMSALLEYNPKEPTLDKKYLTEEEMEKCFAVAISKGNYRDAYLLKLAYFLYRRGVEMRDLKVGDIDLRSTPRSPYGKYQWVDTKGGAGRKTWNLEEREQKLIQEWLEIYPTLFGVTELKPTDYLFCRRRWDARSAKGRPDTYRHWQGEWIGDYTHLMRPLYEDAGVYERGKGFHATRRGSMEEDYNHFIDAGIEDPIPHLQAKASHSTPEQTRKYLNRQAAQDRAEKAFMGLRSAPPSPKESQETPQEESSNVVQFAALRRRRGIG